MPKLEPLPCSVVKSFHINLGAQQCDWFLVAIFSAIFIMRSAAYSAAIRGDARRLSRPLLAMRPAAGAHLSLDPRHDPAHFRQKA
jgi:hypothetical protein